MFLWVTRWFKRSQWILICQAFVPDCIPLVILKNCEPELSYNLAELFNKCIKESCFPDSWKVSSVVHVFKNVVERSTAKNYQPVSLLSVVSKVFGKPVNKIVEHREKCGLISDSCMVLGLLDQLQIFWQLYLIELLGLLNRSRANPGVQFDISKAFYRV